MDALPPRRHGDLRAGEARTGPAVDLRRPAIRRGKPLRRGAAGRPERARHHCAAVPDVGGGRIRDGGRRRVHLEPIRARGRGLAAAEELAAIDRTQRRFWSTTVGSTVANALATRGDGAGVDEIVQWHAILGNHHEHHEPFMFVLLLGNVAESLVDVEPGSRSSWPRSPRAGRSHPPQPSSSSPT